MKKENLNGNKEVKEENLEIYICFYCNKKFGKLRNFRRYKRYYSEVRNFVCEVCGKLYRDNIVLKIYMRIYIGERMFECE